MQPIFRSKGGLKQDNKFKAKFKFSPVLKCENKNVFTCLKMRASLFLVYEFFLEFHFTSVLSYLLVGGNIFKAVVYHITVGKDSVVLQEDKERRGGVRAFDTN